jgi:hypothetical protein
LTERKRKNGINGFVSNVVVQQVSFNSTVNGYINYASTINCNRLLPLFLFLLFVFFVVVILGPASY